MKEYASLLEALIFSPRRSVKRAHLAQWLQNTPQPDRGWGLAALIGELSFPAVKAGLIRKLASQTTDPELFALCYDFVGDLAETVSLLWPAQDAHLTTPTLSECVDVLAHASRSCAEKSLSELLHQMNESERWALLKLATGGMRVGVSARMARLALCDAFEANIDEIEEIWPLLSPPYDALFDWLAGTADKPEARGRAVFRPMMLAHPLDERELTEMTLIDWQVEWKWDGARIQLVSADDGVKLFSRSGDDISAAFPELVHPMSWRGVLDGEILAGTPERIASFNALQQRLNRKTASAKLRQEAPVFLRIYDMLFCGDEDLRGLTLSERRQRLEHHYPEIDHDVMDISAVIKCESRAEMEQLRSTCRSSGLIEGVMIKSRHSLYVAGRQKGNWYKWKRDPLVADLVIMYAQRGHGKRSSFYSDFTFGAWRDTDCGEELVPVGKAYSGFTDAELKQLDKFVREHITARFGPVREVEQKLVVEVAFDSIHSSSRHKSGVAMRFPRFSSIRWDKPVEEADRLEGLRALIS